MDRQPLFSVLGVRIFGLVVGSWDLSLLGSHHDSSEGEEGMGGITTIW